MGKPNAIAIATGKGGALKSSVTANVAGMLAASGWKVGIIELDRQGNQVRLLGASDRLPPEERGIALWNAVTTGAPVEACDDVRPGLDLLCAGTGTKKRLDRFLDNNWDALLLSLGAWVDDHDLVLIDCPPQNDDTNKAALTLANHLLVPTPADDLSIDGLAEASVWFEEVKYGADTDIASHGPLNPDLELLGVVITNVPTAATAKRARARDELRRELGPKIPIFDATIRHSFAAAVDQSTSGQLAYEYEAAYLAERDAFFSGGASPTRAKAGTGLADDYQALTAEIVNRLREASEQQ